MRAWGLASILGFNPATDFSPLHSGREFHMGFLGLTELLVLVALPILGMIIAAFCLALAAYRRVRRLERRLEDPMFTRSPRP